jgi:DNA repair protein RadC
MPKEVSELVRTVAAMKNHMDALQRRMTVSNMVGETDLSPSIKRILRSEFSRGDEPLDLEALAATIEAFEQEERREPTAAAAPSRVRESQPRPTICPTEKACRYIDAEVAWLSQPEHATEHASALYFDRAGEVCGAYRHTDNQPRSCTFDIPTIIREARSHGAAAVWAAHNHPRSDAWSEVKERHWWGAIEPSDADRRWTEDLQAALRKSGLAFIDHTVCGPNAIPFSFREAEQPMLTDWDYRMARLQQRGY